jgi:hypothetical protein
MEWLTKLPSIVGLLLVGLSISPSGDNRDSSKGWLANQWQWTKTFDKMLACPVINNPRFLYAGLIAALLGILFS